MLILHPGALGDIILSLPAVRALRERFPYARITFAADSDFARAVTKGYADRVISLSALPLHRLFGSAPIPPGDVPLWRFYDRIVSWTGSSSASYAENLARIHPDALVACWKPEGRGTRHVADIFLDSLRPWIAGRDAAFPVSITLDESLPEQARDWLKGRGWRQDKPLFALHPGAGSPAKRWPAAAFLALGRRLTDYGELLVVEGPAERGLGSELAASIGPHVILASDISLSLLAAVLSMCGGFVGNDSGIAHLAAGVQTPCVVLFGPTLPEQWRPLGPRVAVLREASGCPACASPADAVHRCMKNITLDMIWPCVMEMINFCRAGGSAAGAEPCSL